MARTCVIRFGEVFTSAWYARVQMDRALAPNLRIAFAPPGFFLNDAGLSITLDGYTVYSGSFTRGFELMFPVAPGVHLVTTCIDIGLVRRTREYHVPVTAGRAFSVVLDYSRFWGNFTKKPQFIAH